MLSVPLDIPGPSDPLDFDDLLDIAREFEFTRTITHIWPCEDDPSTCHETALDDILAAIVSMPSDAQECPAPSPGSAHNPGPLSKDTDRVRPAPALCGWSPPSGSQFLDLDDTLMFPQPMTDTWNSPWLATLLSTQWPAANLTQSSIVVSGTSDSQPQTTTSLTALQPLPVSTTDDPGRKSAPVPMHPPTRAILEPICVRSPTQTTSNAASSSLTTPHAKTHKSRPHPPATGVTPTTHYGRAPRGGLPPHIAREVTKALILHVEKERKAMQDTVSSTTVGQGKKPSVLRKATKVERASSKKANGGGGGKKLFDWDEYEEKGGRASKRARV